ncbi:hypothetical protein E3T28_09340 [Cryobacterium sinapicolor]|uniref:RNA polymerase sigma factor 70 region 4 type 2 domain-containing protein n=1 Tax=Cryobacterium sinapicolor TaxID=1259236 RepID=A0ABY2J532_9MICO|nr:hypothetical protein [Cryobacterium sinapicolor]TFC98955.1 hypothetical protein E3T28_09340 [Cryobacterium sinapicolor]
MAKKKSDAEEITPRQRRIADLRVSGRTFEEIAAEVGISPEKAHAEAGRVFASLVGEDAATIRTQSELRLDNVLVHANRDLRGASTQSERSTLYGIILRAESQRALLLGLSLKRADQ